MKKAIIILLILYLQLTSLLADKDITRGPDIGEIYFIGQTVTGEGIFHSTDFGETATCMDSSYTHFQNESICADLTHGGLYSIRSNETLYHSNNYGQTGSWVIRNYPISDVSSGRNEGVLYNKSSSHSNNYGISFTQHSLNGYFGSRKETEIDCQNSIGYILTTANEPDSVYLLITHDNFENVLIRHVFDLLWFTDMFLSRGYNNGELYLFSDDFGYGNGKELRYSIDYGESWELKNTLNCPNLPFKGIVGGKQPGELYILFECIQFAFLINYTYIYHSLDYGETFTLYNPIAIGPEPNYANFEATPTSGTVPLTCQFNDLSSGQDIVSWEWDFDNDGIIDSYEQNPEYTYQDTGSYSVSLTIFYLDTNTASKEDYIHVMSDVGDIDQLIINNNQLFIRNYPNPFNPTTTIKFSIQNNSIINLSIFNIKGQKIKTLAENDFSQGSHSIIWNGEDELGIPVCSGIYYYKLKVNGKTEAVEKCLLLK